MVDVAGRRERLHRQGLGVGPHDIDGLAVGAGGDRAVADVVQEAGGRFGDVLESAVIPVELRDLNAVVDRHVDALAVGTAGERFDVVEVVAD